MVSSSFASRRRPGSPLRLVTSCSLAPHQSYPRPLLAWKSLSRLPDSLSPPPPLKALTDQRPIRVGPAGLPLVVSTIKGGQKAEDDVVATLCKAVEGGAQLKLILHNYVASPELLVRLRRGEAGNGIDIFVGICSSGLHPSFSCPTLPCQLPHARPTLPFPLPPRSDIPPPRQTLSDFFKAGETARGGCV